MDIILVNVSKKILYKLKDHFAILIYHNLSVYRFQINSNKHGVFSKEIKKFRESIGKTYWINLIKIFHCLISKTAILLIISNVLKVIRAFCVSIIFLIAIKYLIYQHHFVFSFVFIWLMTVELIMNIAITKLHKKNNKLKFVNKFIYKYNENFMCNLSIEF